MLWCLLTWQRPFDHYAEAADVAQALAERGERPALPDEAAAAALPGGSMPARRDYLLLVQQCWAEEPALRPSFEQVGAAGSLPAAACCCAARAVWAGAVQAGRATNAPPSAPSQIAAALRRIESKLPALEAADYAI